jgi:hypothetical protein
MLPYDVLEHIASFADIDTRRAMGFSPRSLPPSNLSFPLRAADTRRIILNDRTHLFVGSQGNEIAWVFGADDFMKSRTYCFERNGRTTLYGVESSHSGL